MSHRSAYDDLPPSYDEVMKNTTPGTTTLPRYDQISDTSLRFPSNFRYSTSVENIPSSNSSSYLSPPGSQLNRGNSSRSAEPVYDSNDEYPHLFLCGLWPVAPVSTSAPPTVEVLQQHESATEAMQHAMSISLVLKQPTHQRVIDMIQLLSTMSYEKRLEVSSAHFRKYGLILAQIFGKLFKNYTPDIRDLMIGLVLPFHEYLGDSIKNTSDLVWIHDFVFTLSNTEINGILSYLLHLNINVEQCLKAKLPIVSFSKEGILIQAIITMMKGIRFESTNVYEENLNRDLFILTRREPIAKKTAFIQNVFFRRCFNHIKALSERYFSETGETVISLIERFFPDSSKTFLNILEYSINKQSYFANLLRSLLTSKKLFFDTKIDTQLSSILLARSKAGDLDEIQQKYYTLFGEQLSVRITKRTAGMYKLALHCLLGSITTDVINLS